MLSVLSDELLAIAETVCRAAREHGKPVFNVYHGESGPWTEQETGGAAKEMENWLT